MSREGEEEEEKEGGGKRQGERNIILNPLVRRRDPFLISVEQLTT